LFRDLQGGSVVRSTQPPDPKAVDLLDKLRSANLLSLEEVDAYASVGSAAGASKEELGNYLDLALGDLTEEQKTTARGIRKMPGGVQLVVGGAGTGKTY